MIDVVGKPNLFQKTQIYALSVKEKKILMKKKKVSVDGDMKMNGIANGEGCSCGPNEDCMWCRSHWER